VVLKANQGGISRNLGLTAQSGVDIVPRRWSGASIVAASGPSLTEDVAALCRSLPVVAVNDAYKLLPHADVLYGCDDRWWRARDGVSEFVGEKWTSVDNNRWTKVLPIAKQYGMRVVIGRAQPFFSLDPRVIHYGRNSGFQAINLALLLGGNPLLLVGFDFRNVDGRTHFFGDHQKPLANTHCFKHWIEQMEWAAKKLPPGIEIINCTPDSAIDCFQRRELRETLQEHINGAEANNAA
jgi:hypothetical protein